MKKMLSFVLCLLLALSCIGAANAESVYPVQTDVELDVWMASSISYSSTYASANEHPWFQAWEDRTGIAVNWIEPAVGADKTQAYNLMLAGGDYPDLIYDRGVVSNAASYLEDGVIVPLNDYLEQYAPNLWALMQSNADIEKSYKTDDGAYYCFPTLNGPTTSTGMIVNQAWLDECGLEAPETIEDVTNMLIAFKEKYNVIPFSMVQTPINTFFSAYGVTGNNGLYRTQDQVVHLANAEEGFRDALRLLHSWYEQGLLDPDFASVDQNTLAAKAAAGDIGAYVQAYTTFQQIDAALDGKENTFVGVKNPVLNAGDPYHYFANNGWCSSIGTALTSACEYPEIACQFMDYVYTEEGSLFLNFGYEQGEDASSEAAWYFDAEGNPRYTDFFMNGPEGMVEYARRYCPGIVWGGPGIKLSAAGRDRNSQIMRDAEDIWRNGSDEDWWCLPVLSATAEEAERYADLNNAIKTYYGEMYYQFITGEADIESDWAGYIDTMKGMGLDEMLAIKQAQLDRFNAR